MQQNCEINKKRYDIRLSSPIRDLRSFASCGLCAYFRLQQGHDRQRFVRKSLLNKKGTFLQHLLRHLKISQPQERPKRVLLSNHYQLLKSVNAYNFSTTIRQDLPFMWLILKRLLLEQVQQKLTRTIVLVIIAFRMKRAFRSRAKRWCFNVSHVFPSPSCYRAMHFHCTCLLQIYFAGFTKVSQTRKTPIPVWSRSSLSHVFSVEWRAPSRSESSAVGI